jgi:hypothetical protein
LKDEKKISEASLPVWELLWAAVEVLAGEPGPVLPAGVRVELVGPAGVRAEPVVQAGLAGVRVEPAVVLEVEDVPVAVRVEVEPEVEDAPAEAVVPVEPAEPVAVRAGTEVEVEDAPGAVRPRAGSAVGRDVIVIAVEPDAPAAVRDGCPVAQASSEAGQDVLAVPLVVLVWFGAGLVVLGDFQVGRALLLAGLVGRGGFLVVRVVLQVGRGDFRVDRVLLRVARGWFPAGRDGR